jgi:hypothetical protein
MALMTVRPTKPGREKRWVGRQITRVGDEPASGHRTRGVEADRLSAP